MCHRWNSFWLLIPASWSIRWVLQLAVVLSAASGKAQKEYNKTWCLLLLALCRCHRQMVWRWNVYLYIRSQIVTCKSIDVQIYCIFSWLLMSLLIHESESELGLLSSICDFGNYMFVFQSSGGSIYKSKTKTCLLLEWFDDPILSMFHLFNPSPEPRVFNNSTYSCLKPWAIHHRPGHSVSWCSIRSHWCGTLDLWHGMSSTISWRTLQNQLWSLSRGMSKIDIEIWHVFLTQELTSVFRICAYSLVTLLLIQWIQWFLSVCGIVSWGYVLRCPPMTFYSALSEWFRLGLYDLGEPFEYQGSCWRLFTSVYHHQQGSRDMIVGIVESMESPITYMMIAFSR